MFLHEDYDISESLSSLVSFHGSALLGTTRVSFGEARVPTAPEECGGFTSLTKPNRLRRK